MNEIELNKRYIKACSDGKMMIRTCSQDEAIMLSYIDTDDTMYYRCTACRRITKPGLADLKALDARLDEIGY